MTFFNFLSLFFGLVSLLFIIKSVLDLGRKTILTLAIGTYSYALHFLFLMELNGFLMNLISGTRNILSQRFYQSKSFFIITISVMIIAFVVFYQSSYDFWILGANLCSTSSVFFLGNRTIKAGLALSYLQSLIYTYFAGSFIAAFIIVVLILGLIKGSIRDRKHFKIAQ